MNEDDKPQQVLVLSRDDVRQAFTMPVAIEALRRAYCEFHAGNAECPPRTLFAVGPHDTDVQTLVMPALLKAEGTMCVKLSSIQPKNPGRGRPLIHGAVTLMDLETGAVTGLIEGASLTALRTGAMAGLATDALARRDAAVLSMVGAGAQARSIFQAVCAVRAIDEVRLWSRTSARTAQMAAWIAETQGFAGRVVSYDSVEEAVQGAAIVCTATATGASEPLVAADWLAPGVHVNVIGGIHEDALEVSPALIPRAVVVVEQRSAALAEAGEIRHAVRADPSQEQRILEIGAVLTGATVGRQSAAERTIFRSVGHSLQDAAVAQAVFRRARQLGCGLEVPL